MNANRTLSAVLFVIGCHSEKAWSSFKQQAWNAFKNLESKESYRFPEHLSIVFGHVFNEKHFINENTFRSIRYETTRCRLTNRIKNNINQAENIFGLQSLYFDKYLLILCTWFLIKKKSCKQISMKFSLVSIQFRIKSLREMRHILSLWTHNVKSPFDDY